MIQTLLVALCALSLVSAGPHGRNGLSARRRHHFRAVRKSAPVAADPLGGSKTGEKRDCEEGAWQCLGAELQRCNYDAWVPIANCTGDNIVCSSDERAVGCIWSWSLDDAQPVVATHISVAEPLPSTSILAPQSSAASTDATSLPTSTYDASSSASPSATWSASPSAALSDSLSASPSAGPSATETSIAASSSAAAIIGGNLWAGGDESTTRPHKHRSSTQDWYAAPTHDRSSSAPSPSASDPSTTPLGTSASASASDDSEWNPSTTNWYQPTYSPTASPAGPASSAAWSETSAAWSVSSASYSNDLGESSWTWTSSSRSGRKTTTSSAASQPTGGASNTAPSGSYPAPHYVIYADNWLSSMPAASDLSSYNRFILAFWMAQRGAVDNAQAWEQFDADYRQQVLDEYHAAGIALMVSAFGSTDSPTSDGQDPADVAQRLAAWVKQYGLDGVDIDYEDMPAMNNNQAEQWLITFQTTLRQLLPAPYLISHAPVAPWFTSGNDYPSGAYVAVHQQTGSGIDWYNVQFYNQGSGVYEDCYSLITDSGSDWPDTSVMGINSYAKVPLDKIVIGKPLDAGAAANGYVDGSLLATCVAQAQSEGWNAGIMFWEWAPLVAGNLMATVRGS